MTASAHETPPAMVLSIAEAICDRPGDTAARREARLREIVRTVMAFGPNNPVEIMLAGMAVTHAYLLQDTASSAVREPDETIKGRAKSTVVALSRAMVGVLKELRLFQKRTADRAARPAGERQPVAQSLAAHSAALEARPAHMPDAEKVTAASFGAQSERAQPAVLASTARPGVRAAKSAVPSPAFPAARRPAATANPPVPLLPPLRYADASVAAMLSVLPPGDASSAVVPPSAAGSGRPHAAVLDLSLPTAMREVLAGAALLMSVPEQVPA